MLKTVQQFVQFYIFEMNKYAVRLTLTVNVTLSQADKLVSKCTFPQTANNNEMARHLYYLGN